MSFVDRLNDASPCDKTLFLPFLVDNIKMGLVKHRFASVLERFPHVFKVCDKKVCLSSTLKSFEERTNLVSEVLTILRHEKIISGWRNELYPVTNDLNTPALFAMERAATGLFGIRSYAVSINGYVKRNNNYYLWVGQRSESKETYPSKLDLMVGGGQPFGITLEENIIKECYEEAGLSEHISKKAISVGGISFCCEQGNEIINQFQFTYDLKLSQAITPKNIDGEVKGFRLVPVHEIMDTLATTDDFMFDSALVILDFLIRHGQIPANHPSYIEIVSNLRYNNHQML